jgi:hypothetical protein
MFLDEAKLAAHLQHPNIAQVFDVGVLAGSYFFTMELVHGKDVRQLLQRVSARRRELPIELALHIAAGTLAALHHAHERVGTNNVPLGVVHRDVSPSNLMVSYEGVVKLLDFGIAKAAQNTSETHAGTIKGKISYLSPEQCRGLPIDRRSDIFAMGIVLHEMLTCRRLYKRDSDFVTMEAIAHELPPAPSSIRADVPPELDQIVLRALEKDPERRFATAAEMLEAIEAVAARRQLALSATAMGRFMREQFGERKEPWSDLGAAGELTQMTVSGDSLAPLEGVDSGERALAAQLEQAPLLSMTGSRVEAEPLTSSEKSSSRWLRVGAIALTLIGIGIGTAFWVSGAGEPSLARVPPRTDASVAVVASGDTAQFDAGTADAAVAAPEPSRRTIETALAASDWVGTLELCVASSRLGAPDRSRCGIAACNAGRTTIALDYYGQLTGALKQAVERACEVHRIALRKAPAIHRDACETDPLACQK